jgi:hypothetical protein
MAMQWTVHAREGLVALALLSAASSAAAQDARAAREPAAVALEPAVTEPAPSAPAEPTIKNGPDQIATQLAPLRELAPARAMQDTSQGSFAPDGATGSDAAQPADVAARGLDADVSTDAGPVADRTDYTLRKCKPILVIPCDPNP